MRGNQTVIENERLKIMVSAVGGELIQMYDKENKREIIWEGDPLIWEQHSPILFPFVGRCFQGTYRYQGHFYEMGLHGFAKDCIFERVKWGEKEVVYELTTKKEYVPSYPFLFRLQVGYQLLNCGLNIWFRVENQGYDVMPFMIGGHPGFKVPKGMNLYDLSLQFPGKKVLHYLAPDEDGMEDMSLQGEVLLNEGRFLLKPGFMNQVLTYIFDQGQVEEVCILLPNQQPYVTLTCKGFPYFGVWTVEKAHAFLCLEPWYGMCDQRGEQGDVTRRKGVLSLEPGKYFDANYTIQIH